MKFCRSRNNFCVLTFLVLMGLSGQVFAALATIIEQGAKWNYVQYNYVPDGDEQTWENTWYLYWEDMGYDSFDWAGANWNEGYAAFGNTADFGSENVPQPLSNTYWSMDHGLALRRTYYLDGAIKGDLTLNAAFDNGLMVFVNGTQVFKLAKPGYAAYWDVTLGINPSVFVQGMNVIEVLAEDHGGGCFFDMELSGDIVPEPGTLLLMGTGMMCWLRNRRSL
jgi:hypothetical protein